MNPKQSAPILACAMSFHQRMSADAFTLCQSIDALLVRPAHGQLQP
jgi:hypothetical protein